ncbi:YihY/virulence factor BrkB family protein [Spelaeicoccus albus]|uniref:Membrane protein n=1 Tax=Spelaeicoccus albus TaxID=1280376 RepID=A0A7Z0D5J1_9MICO|nr:YihY/virulence factor BrkB family protein [Spelaeicoccus albus]NYI69287.1 membrane protein [Spelaeicoccus albus]
MPSTDLTADLDTAPPQTRPPAVDLAALTLRANRVNADPGASPLKKRMATIETWLPVRAYRHYSGCRGNQFAASIGYFGLFSVFAMLAVAISVFGFVLRDNPDLRQRVFDEIGKSLPGLGDSGMLSQKNGMNTSGLTLGVVIGGVSLLLTATGWMNALSQGIRAVALRPVAGGNALLGKVYQIVVMVVLGIVVLLSAASSFVTGFAKSALQTLGIDSAWANAGVVVLSLAIALALDTLVAYALFRFVGRLRVLNRLAWEGALIAGIGFSVIKYFGSALLGKATSNPLLASGATLVGLLIWFNLLGRVILLAASWTTLRFSDGHVFERARELAEQELNDGRGPLPGRKGAHRAATATGVLIGAGGVLGGAAAVRACRRALAVFRRDGP